MSDKFGINVSSGISGVASGESGKGVSGEIVEGLKSQTLIGNHGDKGVLSDGVRVSEEINVFVEESSRVGVISGNKFKSVESGNLGTSVKNDASEKRVETVSCNNSRWESWGSINMVSRVLDGRLYTDNEVEDAGDSGNWGGVNLGADRNAWQDVIGEPTSENRIDIKRTDIDNDSVRLDSSGPGEGSGLNGHRDLVSNEMVPNGPLETEEEFNDEPDLLILKARGEYDITKKEGEYYVSDLVWAKVRSHPWWPGQIFPPVAVSDKVARHLKRDSYLIAYFGDQTFAWNKGSKIKPFRMHFSEMEKQSNTDKFSHAVQCAFYEVARRVEFGLSCPCLPQEVLDGIKFQVVQNAAVSEDYDIKAGGDNLSGAGTFSPGDVFAGTFSPGDVLQFLQSLAQRPQSKPDRLQVMIAKAQLMAYNRWKGHNQLPAFRECGGLLEDDTQLNVTGVTEGLLPGQVSEVANDFSTKKRKSTVRDGSSCKRKHLSGDEESPKIKEKLVSALMSSGSSSLQNNDEKAIRRSSRKVISAGRNSEMVNAVVSNSRERRPKSLLSSSPSGEPQTVEMIPAKIPTPDMVLSKLILAAIQPMQRHDAP